jgi:hypothetical protein
MAHSCEKYSNALAMAQNMGALFPHFRHPQQVLMGIIILENETFAV